MRSLLIRIGEWIKKNINLKTLLTIYGLAVGVGGGYVIVNLFIGVTYTPKSPRELAIDVVISFLWLLLFFVFIYLTIQGSAKFFIWLGNYYPKFYYFPKIEVSASITTNKNIELTIVNPKKRKKYSLRAIYRVVQSPDVIIGVSGVAPESVKELLPIDTMEGKSSRKVSIGKIDDGMLVLSGGINSKDDMKFSSPGLYNYYVAFVGMFRGRNYSVDCAIPIRITENKEILIDDENNK